MQGRTAKGWSQKDLATKINEKTQVINEYESGKVTPNNQILGKIEKKIGISLRGKNIGEPLSSKKKKQKKNKKKKKKKQKKNKKKQKKTKKNKKPIKIEIFFNYKYNYFLCFI